MKTKDSFVGKECFFVDKVTRDKKYDGAYLGKCIDEKTHSVTGELIVWFDNPFLDFVWQRKSDVRIAKDDESKPPRDVYQELRRIGLTHDQCHDVCSLINTLTPEEIKNT
jgi:hypothetical protein